MAIEEKIIKTLRESGALKSGHFLLSSGLHSDRYCQCATLFENPKYGRQVAKLMSQVIPSDFRIDVVLAPALGAVLWGYELASFINARSIFAERKPGQPFELRRGFQINKGEKVLLAEDVITTGKSIKEMVPLVEEAGGEVAGFATIVDRSRSTFKPEEQLFSLVSLDFETYQPEDCPLCNEGKPLVKPGSRDVKASEKTPGRRDTPT